MLLHIEFSDATAPSLFWYCSRLGERLCAGAAVMRWTAEDKRSESVFIHPIGAMAEVFEARDPCRERSTLTACADDGGLS